MRTIRWSQVIIAFLLGFVVAAGLLHQKRRWIKPDPARRFDRMMDRFNERLDLTPEQRDKVGAIFRAKREKIDALRAEVEPRFEEIRRNASQEIRQLLTPEQQARFEKMEKDREERMREWRGRRGQWGGRR
jgi:Spy/CpxP family protein refolding chaperone